MAGHDGYTRYTVRIPTPLYERVKQAAGEKSVNAEIVGTLEEAYPEPLPDYRTLLKMIFDHLEENGAPEELKRLSDEIMHRVNDLPEHEGEELARELGDPILEALENKVAEIRASQKADDTPSPSPDADD